MSLLLQSMCHMGLNRGKGSSSPWGFPGGSVIKNLLALQETRVQSLAQEEALEEGMATHSSIPAWRIP